MAFKRLGVLSAIFLSIFLTLQAHGAGEIRYYDIPAGPLDAALVRLAEQANISLALPDDSLANIGARSVAGYMSAENVLQSLLAGTPYTFVPTGDAAWRIVPAADAPSAASTEIRPPETFTIIGRMPETLDAMPRSVGHVSGARIDELGAHSASDLAGELGGIAFTNTGQGRNKVFIRGISDGAIAAYAQSTTAIYLDDVRLTYAAPDPDLQLVDLRAAEVLRGPQGALYGAGAIGGVLRLETAPVDLWAQRYSAYVAGETVMDGEFGNDVELMANVPVVHDRFGLRGVFYRQVFGGWLDQRGRDVDGANHTVRAGGRLAALWQPTDDLEVGATVVSQFIDADDSQYLIEGAGGTLSRPQLVEPHDNDFLMGNIVVRADTGIGEITATTAAISHELRNRYDATGLFTDLGLDPDGARPLDRDDQFDILLQETRLASRPGARLPWVIGTFLSYGENETRVRLHDGTKGAWTDTAYLERRRDLVSEAALFGRITWPIAPNLSFETGARAFSYHLDTHSFTDVTALGSTSTFDGKTSDQGLAPDVRLSWQATARLRVFASAAEGHRSPGFNTGGTDPALFASPGQPSRRFDGDELWTYELGARFATLDDCFSASVTGFYNDWRRVQTDELIAGDMPYTGNAGNSRTLGLEAEATYRPIEGLTLRGNLLINDPELTGPDPSYPALAETGLPGAPEFSGALSAQYERDLPWVPGNARGIAEIETTYTGEAVLGFGRGTPIGDYEETNVRLTLATDVGELSLYVDNVFDSDGATFSNGNPYQVDARDMITPQRPRLVGVSFRRTF